MTINYCSKIGQHTHYVSRPIMIPVSPDLFRRSGWDAEHGGCVGPMKHFYPVAWQVISKCRLWGYPTNWNRKWWAKAVNPKWLFSDVCKNWEMLSILTNNWTRHPKLVWYFMPSRAGRDEVRRVDNWRGEFDRVAMFRKSETEIERDNKQD